MTPDDMRAIALAIPGSEESFSMGSVAFKLNGKVLVRLLDEDVMLTGIGYDEREMLLEAEPQTFHITPHYKDDPAVMARLETLDPGALRSFLWRRWREIARKADIKAHDAIDGGGGEREPQLKGRRKP